ncbi:PaaI family thioesterase [Hyphococcus flavus]|uniref:PaaI family thioesterase n=1 Tax=Hyphococcus flavus TaxID=1866326 RepID=A0AAE9ZJP2_9PROT|nr:PaaI family thioesterase [Hyphococcus flavus]WDI31815.1 PaaI family thioesterase [Hyphococcus flavus]
MTEKNTFGGGSGTALDKIPQPACAAFLGYELLSVDREAKTMRVAFRGTKEMLNPRGGVQGGFLTAMLDDASGSMVVVLTNGAKAPASVDIHTQYFKPAGVERLICEAELVHMTKSTAFTRATLYNEAGEKVAAASQTARLLDLQAGTSR